MNKSKRSIGEKEVLKALGKGVDGLTITELVDLSKLSRSTIRVALAMLEGKEEIRYRSVGMAKMYFLGGER